MQSLIELEPSQEITQSLAEDDLVFGHFVAEGSNRFVGQVLVQSTILTCYIPFSSRISKHLNPIGRSVALRKTGPISSPRYTLHAILVRETWCFLELAKVPQLVQKLIELPGAIISREQAMIEGYRADLVCHTSKMVWEIKTVLSEEVRVEYPGVSSFRMEKQLVALSRLQEQGWAVVLVFALLAPWIESVEMSQEQKVLKNLFRTLKRNWASIVPFTIGSYRRPEASGAAVDFRAQGSSCRLFEDL